LVVRRAFGQVHVEECQPKLTQVTDRAWRALARKGEHVLLERRLGERCERAFELCRVSDAEDLSERLEQMVIELVIDFELPLCHRPLIPHLRIRGTKLLAAAVAIDRRRITGSLDLVLRGRRRTASWVSGLSVERGDRRSPGGFDHFGARVPQVGPRERGQAKEAEAPGRNGSW
jgi:hypothetical protein